jgi:hypothetical protein
MYDLESIIFVSPFIYNAVLLLTWLGKKMHILSSIDKKYVNMHNYIMTGQSVFLLALTVYGYFTTSTLYNIPSTHFREISTTGIKNTPVYNFIMFSFLFSKVYEWIDTILLILNDKPIITLHWWHHATITVAFFTGTRTGALFWIGGLNSFIHIIMYLYYADVKSIKPFARYITTLQIFHLFGGVYMNYLTMFSKDEIVVKYSYINACICLSYGIMFLFFYSKKYTKSKPNKNGNKCE